MIHPGQINGYQFPTVQEKLDKEGIEDFEISAEEFLALLKQEDYDLSLAADIDGNLEIADIDSIASDLDLCTSNMNGDVTIKNCSLDSLSFEHTYIYGKFVMENVTITGNLIMPENLEEIIVNKGISIKNLKVEGRIYFQKP